MFNIFIYFKYIYISSEHHKYILYYKSYCSNAHFCRTTSIYQPTNALLKRFKTLRHVSTLSNHHQGPLILAKVMLQYWYLQTRCCGSMI